MNDENLNQIAAYFENVPLWPFIFFGFLGLVALAIDLLNRKRRALAIEDFRGTIETELALMYPKHKGWPRNINSYLCSRLPEMQQNFEILRVFIPQDRLLSYNTDWNNFCDFCRNITDEKCAAAEQPASGIDDGANATSQEPDPKVVLHGLIEKLLKHTEI